MKTPYFIQWIAGLFSLIVPLFVARHPQKIVLAAFHGDGYRGNTRILFEYLCNHPEFQPVWLSRQSSIVKTIQKRHGRSRAESCHSLRGLYQLAASSAILLTHGTSDLPFLYLPRRALCIQTYHGLPTKRGEYLTADDQNRPGWPLRLLYRYRYRPITHFLSSSPQVTDIFSRRFGLPHPLFLETGYPAYDPLMGKAGNRQATSEFLSRMWPEAPPSQKLILYAPTFRRKTRTRWFPFEDLDIEKLSGFLERHQALMALRPHPNDPGTDPIYLSSNSRIVFAGDELVEDPVDLVMHADAIVTDYSSIYLEGLLADIPAIFLPYDLDSYERGFPLPYSQVTPGEKVFSQKHFLRALQKALLKPEDFQSVRRKVRDLYFSQVDGKATKRVVSFLKKNLLENT